MSDAGEPRRPEVEEVVRAVVARHVGPPRRMAPLHGGLSNHAFDVQTDREDVVVRLSDKPDKLAAFEREQRAAERARSAGVPTQVIVALGREGAWAYIVAQRLPGGPAVHHPERLRILEEVGRIAKLVHAIPTEGFGHHFTWTGDGGGSTPPGAATWRAFLIDELHAEERLAKLAQLDMLSDHQVGALRQMLAEISAWDGRPVLNHGDLRLKNVVVDDEGHILGVIDWESAVSVIGPHWDLSIALHDLSIDAKQAFLTGYEMADDDVRQAAAFWRLFNVLNYVPTIDRLLETEETAEIDRIRTRLSGALDLYAVDQL